MGSGWKCLWLRAWMAPIWLSATTKGAAVASFEDRQDFEDAERGRIDALDPCVVRAADGRVVWDLTAYAYLDGECPDTV
jgi:alkyl sulfatase BDS1-like metallo-beta-lactamase superfamily hydrolase